MKATQHRRDASENTGADVGPLVRRAPGRRRPAVVHATVCNGRPVLPSSTLRDIDQRVFGDMMACRIDDMWSRHVAEVRGAIVLGQLR